MFAFIFQKKLIIMINEGLHDVSKQRSVAFMAYDLEIWQHHHFGIEENAEGDLFGTIAKFILKEKGAITFDFTLF